MSDPQTQEQALTSALLLAITAPTDEQAERATALAVQLSAGLDEATVEQCKAAAAEQAEAETTRCACGRSLDANGEHDGGYGAWCG